MHSSFPKLGWVSVVQPRLPKVNAQKEKEQRIRVLHVLFSMFWLAYAECCCVGHSLYSQPGFRSVFRLEPLEDTSP